MMRWVADLRNARCLAELSRRAMIKLFYSSLLFTAKLFAVDINWHQRPFHCASRYAEPKGRRKCDLERQQKSTAS